MPGLGWAFDAEQDAWLLLDRYGLTAGTVTAQVLYRCGAAEVNRAGARKMWPELAGEPWWHLVLAGGPLDGQHEYLDPRDHAEPPDELTFAADTLVSAQPGDAAGFHPDWPAVTYRRQIQVCGHGRSCPYPYAEDRGLW